MAAGGDLAPDPRGREHSPAHAWNPGVAESPQHPLTTQKGEIVQATYMCECEAVRACMREISEGIVGSEAQLGVATNRHKSSLGAGSRTCCPVWPSKANPQWGVGALVARSAMAALRRPGAARRRLEFYFL